MGPNETRSGRFIVLEGPDGCGKSTQARRLVSWLTRGGREALHLRDPGGTRVGEKVRDILLDPLHEEIVPRAEALLFMASRAQLADERIRPALSAGTVVVCERWIASTVCYQGHAGGLDPEAILAVGEMASGGLSPDLTLVLDVDPAIGLDRTGDDPDLMERRPLEFHRRVREGYLEVCRQGLMNARLVPPGTIEEMEHTIRGIVADLV